MKVRIRYIFQGRRADFITATPEATFTTFEDYVKEVQKLFPGATVEIVSEENNLEIIEAES
jgi:hypothetical protein